MGKESALGASVAAVADEERKGAPPDDGRYLPSGDEAGTAPQDRAFRPDVEGLRAVAILLVVLVHSAVPHVQGGGVGVDAFFVISGFVITGLLLRDHQATGGISMVHFYARRARRILPMAILVIVVSVITIDLIASHGDAVRAASDGRWSAVFLANLHFIAVDPNVLVPRPVALRTILVAGRRGTVLSGLIRLSSSCWWGFPEGGHWPDAWPSV